MAIFGNKDTAAVTGTIGIPNASATLTGVSTAFLTDLYYGVFVTIASIKYKVLSVTSNTVATLTSNYEGTTIASGETITKQTAPKHLTYLQARDVVFVSAEEAALTTNKNKGIRNPGWWRVTEKKTSDGTSRYLTECLATMNIASATSGDGIDDTQVADAEVTLTISAQPTAQNTSSGAATFSITVTASSGSVTYQWQRAPVAANTKFVNVSAATSASLVLSGRTAANTGDLYRCVLSSTSGAIKVNSTAVALTFVS
jgi:hypothetical protein